jgi:hypothetical protein
MSGGPVFSLLEKKEVMKRILLAFGLVVMVLIGLNSCAVEGTAYPNRGYYEPQVRGNIYFGTPPPRHYHRHYYHRRYYSPRGRYYYQ